MIACIHTKNFGWVIKVNSNVITEVKLKKNPLIETCVLAYAKLDVRCPVGLKINKSKTLPTPNDSSLVEQYCKKCTFFSAKGYHC